MGKRDLQAELKEARSLGSEVVWWNGASSKAASSRAHSKGALEFRELQSNLLVFVIEEDDGLAGVEGDFRRQTDRSLLDDVFLLAGSIFGFGDEGDSAAYENRGVATTALFERIQVYGEAHCSWFGVCGLFREFVDKVGLNRAAVERHTITRGLAAARDGEFQLIIFGLRLACVWIGRDNRIQPSANARLLGLRRENKDSEKNRRNKVSHKYCSREKHPNGKKVSISRF
jgi:hypothetical protein